MVIGVHAMMRDQGSSMFSGTMAHCKVKEAVKCD